MSDTFTPADGLDLVCTLVPHLQYWHHADRHWHPFARVRTNQEWLMWEEKTFADFLNEEGEDGSGDYPQLVSLLMPSEGSNEQPVAYLRPSAPQDHAVALWLLARLRAQLARHRNEPLWQLLVLTCDRLVKEHAFLVRAPETENELEVARFLLWHQLTDGGSKDPRKNRRKKGPQPPIPQIALVVGRPLPPDILRDLQSAAEAAHRHWLAADAAHPVTVQGTAAEEWLPAAEAASRAEEKGYTITLSWLTRDAKKHGVRTRARQLSGRHKVEIEWRSLAAYLLDHKPQKDSAEQPADEDPSTQERIRRASESKQKERPLN
jgi:hypothetical protein